MQLITVVILSLVTFRLSRLVTHDTIFKEIRERIVYWIAHGKVTFDDEGKPTHMPRRMAKWRDKLIKLVTCPYCLSVWCAGGVTATHHFFVDPLPYPIWVWLAVAGGTLVVWEYTDGE